MKKSMRMTLMAVVAVMTLALGATMLQAQDQQGGDRGGRRGGFDPARMQEFMDRMLDRYKERLGASDEEWNVIKPQISEVMRLQRQARSGGSGFMMMRGGRDRGPGGDQGGQGGDRGSRPSFGGQEMPEAQALNTALENQNTPAPELQAKLAAYREAVKKNEAALKEGRDKLRKVLTLRQEAMLVMAGILD